jgi:hypothetical protein
LILRSCVRVCGCAQDLHCIVCFELPPSEIFQCEHGHMLCAACHARVVVDPRPQCPNCRARLSRDRPHRNRFAEMVLSHHLVSCSHAGCAERVEFRAAVEHETKLCRYRPVKCRYHPMGCEWGGLAKNARAHEKECPILGKKHKSILKRVLKRAEEQTADFKRREHECRLQTDIVRLLTSPAKDIAYKDVVLEKDPLHNEMCSQTFTALNLAWEVALTKPTDGTSLCTAACARVRCALDALLSLCPPSVCCVCGVQLNSE